MIDIHCHILPGIDDGAKDMQEALKMARIAQSEGIKTIINTSHYHPDFDHESIETVSKEAENFNKMLKENNIDLEVLTGRELYYSDDLLDQIAKSKTYTLNGSKYVLIEFSHVKFPKKLCDIIYEFKLKGYKPILAHVERYQEVQENPGIIYDAIQEGALVQVNASSMVHKSLGSLNSTCETLMRQNMVHFVGTDAHGAENRRPLIKDAYQHVCNKYKPATANKLFIENPKSVIDDEDIDTSKAIDPSEKKSFLSKIFKNL